MAFWGGFHLVHFFVQTLEIEAFQIMYPLFNFQRLEVFPVFLGNKKGKFGKQVARLERPKPSVFRLCECVIPGRSQALSYICLSRNQAKCFFSRLIVILGQWTTWIAPLPEFSAWVSIWLPLSFGYGVIAALSLGSIVAPYTLLSSFGRTAASNVRPICHWVERPILIPNTKMFHVQYRWSKYNCFIGNEI